MENAIKFIGILIILVAVLVALVFSFGGDIQSKEDFWSFLKNTWDIKALIEGWGGPL